MSKVKINEIIIDECGGGNFPILILIKSNFGDFIFWGNEDADISGDEANYFSGNDEDLSEQVDDFVTQEAFKSLSKYLEKRGQV